MLESFNKHPQPKCVTYSVVKNDGNCSPRNLVTLDWKQVAWSRELSLQLFRTNKRIRMLCETEKTMDPTCMQGTILTSGRRERNQKWYEVCCLNIVLIPGKSTTVARSEIDDSF
ncbi:hypothetical protein NPIL_386691 [Nephila pilipes]|uniref:Uncharacterized protein n=1 Tax=Nephila pilipes TaxID=299642 RepID=A0A8X6NBA8_NEPPI|nr:hypothetical protein NPIL_386691 [Nephila pilipes]